MKFHQIKIIDVVQTTESEITKIEFVETEFFEIAEIQCFINAVFRFVIVVALVIYLIDFHFDVLIASIAAASVVDALIALM